MRPDRAGNVFYVWNAFLPRRPHPAGRDSVVIAIRETREAWARMLAWDSLPQLLNPASGYLQNANDPPHFTTLAAPLDSAALPIGVPGPALSLRSQLSLSLIHGDDRLDLEDVVIRKHSHRMLLAERIKDDLLAAVAATGDTTALLREAAEVLARWDDTVAPDSRGAVLFEAWWRSYARPGVGAPPPWSRPWDRQQPTTTPDGLRDPAAAVRALAAAAAEVRRRHGTLDVPWGTVHRIRIAGKDIPAGGCSGALGCFRVLQFRDEPDGSRTVTGGESWILAEEFGDTPRAVSVLAYGNDDAFGNEIVLRIVARQKALNFMPGDEHLYSNSGYALLAVAIERATGTPFAEYADANIFKPLGMTVSHFHTDLSRLVPHRAQAYDRRADGTFALNSPQNERAGAGGLFTTVRELVRWDENFYDAKVGGPDVVRMLEIPGRLNSGTELAYAWGLTVGTYRGMPTVEHSGSLGGYRAHVLRFRGAHTSVAVLCNVSNVNTGRVVRRVADAVLGARFAQPVPPARKPAPDPIGPGLAYLYEGGELAAFAGSYYSEELESAYQVSVDGSALKLRRGSRRQVFTLQPGPKDEFRIPGSTIRFRRGPDGTVTGLVVDADRIRGLAFEKR